ncbi:hypothetical protein WK62_20470 [Burkholderia ubonensis]|nr:hypothetical protein WK62_20470 [Burkholderia ubonensis]
MRRVAIGFTLSRAAARGPDRLPRMAQWGVAPCAATPANDPRVRFDHLYGRVDHLQSTAGER